MKRCLQTVKKPFREVWRAEALQAQIESGDMRGGFVSLAQQGFLTLFPAREPLGGERETALYTRKRTPQADFFDTLSVRHNKPDARAIVKRPL